MVPTVAVLAGLLSPAAGASAGLLFAFVAFVLPWLVARDATRGGVGLADAGAGLRIAALDTLTGLREVRAFGAEARMQALIAAREAALIGRQREAARRVAQASAAGLLCGQAALLCVLGFAGGSPALRVMAVFVVIAGFEVIALLPRAGVTAGNAAAAARRVLDVAEGEATLPDPPKPRRVPAGFALQFEGVHFAWAPGAPEVFRRADAGRSAGRARRAAGAVGRGQIDARGACAEGGGAAGGARHDRRH